MEEKNSKIYEVGYTIVPTVSPELITKEVEAIREVIEKKGGKILSEELPKLRQLAYEMLKVTGNKRNKFRTGYFGWIKFNSSEEEVDEIKKTLDVSESILRFILIKTIADNTLYGQKLVQERGQDSEKKEEKPKIPVEKAEISEEELDKSIDKLVIE